jgi:pyruvate,water dikinase
MKRSAPANAESRRDPENWEEYMFNVSPRQVNTVSVFTLPFTEAANEPVTRIGGKCIGLAALVSAKVPVSPGFVVTTDAFSLMMEVDGLGAEIASLVTGLDTNDIRRGAQVSQHICDAIMRRPMPAEIENAIRKAYAELSADGAEAAVAVRSSGTGEDLPDASFAGQGDTFLEIAGIENVLEKVKRCWASLYSARAMSYRAMCGMGRLDVQMAVAVQVMVDSRSAGVAMTLDPANGDRSKIIVESTWGLGETLVSGEVTPDHFMFDKVMLMPVSTRIAHKDHELVVDPATRSALRRPITDDRADAPSANVEELKAIASAAKALERHFGCPQDIEWAISRNRREHGGLVILQSRPETVWSKKKAAGAAQANKGHGVAGVLDTLIAPLLAR